MKLHKSLHKPRSGRPPMPIIGRKVGFLEVIGRGAKGSGRIVCRCECGSVKEYFHSNVLNSEATISCGCKKSQLMSENSRNATHRMRHSSEWNIWQGMVGRCHRTTNSAYKHYGARGIVVCEEWRHSFESFYRDMGSRPGALTLERKDNNGPYSPSNCVWADWFVQANNRRSNVVKILHVGRSLSIAQWAREVGIQVDTLRWRISRGIPMERALTSGSLRKKKVKA